MGAGTTTRRKQWPDWTVVMRRRPVRIVEGSARRRLDRGIRDHLLRLRDDPDRDYRDVSPELQRIRGPYPLGAGVTACEEHVRQHSSPQNRSPALRSARQVSTGRRPG